MSHGKTLPLWRHAESTDRNDLTVDPSRPSLAASLERPDLADFCDNFESHLAVNEGALFFGVDSDEDPDDDPDE